MTYTDEQVAAARPYLPPATPHCAHRGRVRVQLAVADVDFRLVERACDSSGHGRMVWYEWSPVDRDPPSWRCPVCPL